MDDPWDGLRWVCFRYKEEELYISSCWRLKHPSLSVRSRSEEPAENTRSLSALLSGQNLKGTVVCIWPAVPYSRCVTVPHTNHGAAAETAGLTRSCIYPPNGPGHFSKTIGDRMNINHFTTVRAAGFLRRLNYGGGQVGWRWCVTTRRRMKNTCGETHLQ